MANRIEVLVDVLAAQLARKRGIPLVVLRPHVRTVIDAALRHYLLAGAPYGLSETAFMEWLVEWWAVARAAQP